MLSGSLHSKLQLNTCSQVTRQVHARRTPLLHHTAFLHQQQPAANPPKSHNRFHCNCFRRHKSRLTAIAAASQPADSNEASSSAQYVEVEEIKGIRVVLRDGAPQTELWVTWKDGSPDTWESSDDLSGDLIRDYQERWWTAVKKGEIEPIMKFLAGGCEVLCEAVDENRRSALHFAAGLGRLEAVKLLIEAGSDLNLQDKDGYTPLHMAAGYMQTTAMNMLLEAGADPEIKDNNGQDVVNLVSGLKSRVPFTPQTATTVLALEDVTTALTDNMYDEVEPAAILEMREVNGERQFLVQYLDGHDDEWLPEGSLSEQVVKDWENGLEYVEAECVLAIEQLGDKRRYKVRWADGSPDSWEPEEHVSDDLIQLWEEEHPEFIRDEKRRAVQLQLVEQRRAAANGTQYVRMQAPPAGDDGFGFEEDSSTASESKKGEDARQPVAL